MTSVANYKSMVKIILSEKNPDLTDFVDRRLEEFLDSLISYFKHKVRPNLVKKKFLSKQKPANMKQINSCFEKIFPKLKSSTFVNNENLIKKINTVFCYLLHYNTSKTYRPSTITFYNSLLLLINNDHQILTLMLTSFLEIVPFIVLSRTDAEAKGFQKIIPDDIQPQGEQTNANSNFNNSSSSGLNQNFNNNNYNNNNNNNSPNGTNSLNLGYLECDDKDCVVSFKMFLKFMNTNWSDRSALFSEFFYFFLRIIYPKLSQESGFEPLDYGFTSDQPPPPQLFTALIEFISELIVSKSSTQHLFDSTVRIRCFLGFTEACCKNNTGSSSSDVPHVLYMILTSILENPVLVKKIQKISLDLFGSLVNVLCTVVTLSKSHENMEQARDFLGKFFQVMLSTIDRSILVEEIVKLFKKHHYEAFASSFLMISLINVLMNSEEANLDLWKCLTDLATTSDVLSAVSCRYAQYLAALAFPHTVLEDEKIIKDVAINFVRRKERLKIDSVHDEIMKNINDLLDSPDEYVRQNISMSWSDHNEFEKDIMSYLTIPSLNFSKNPNPTGNSNSAGNSNLAEKVRDLSNINNSEILNSKIFKKIELFLNAFAFYRTTESTKDMKNAFAPIYSFCDLFINNRDLPSGLTINPTIVCEVCMERLFIAVLGQNEPTIRKTSFHLLTKLISFGDLRCYFNEEILSKWYLSIGVMLIQDKLEFVEDGFNSALLSVQRGLTGSTMFVPIMLNILEEKLLKHYFTPTPISSGNIIANLNANSSNANSSNNNNSFSLSEIEKSILSFLSSIPLFNANIKANNWIFTELTKIKNKYKKGFVDSFDSFIKKEGTSMKERVMKIIYSKLQSKIVPDNHLVYLTYYHNLIPLYSSLLSDELTNAKPSPEIIKSVFNFLLQGISFSAQYYEQNLKVTHGTTNPVATVNTHNSIEAVFVIKSMFMYIPLFINNFSDIYKIFLEDIIKETLKITPRTESSFAFSLLQLTTELVIESSKLISSETLTKYVKYLSDDILGYAYQHLPRSSSSSTAVFNMNVQTYADQALSLLSMNFGRYPFPMSTYFPMYRGSSLSNDGYNDLQATKGGSLLQFNIDENDNVIVGAQNKTGHYNWKFSPLAKEMIIYNNTILNNKSDQQQNTINKNINTNNKNIINDQEINLNDLIDGEDSSLFPTLTFSFPNLSSNTNTNNTNRKKQEEFVSKFNKCKFSNEFETMTKLEMVNENEDDLMYNIDAIKHYGESLKASKSTATTSLASSPVKTNLAANKNEDTSKTVRKLPRFPKTSSCLEYPAASVSTILGYITPSLEAFTKSVDGANKTALLKLKKINVSNFRHILKIGVVFVGKNVSDQNKIFQTTMQETTPHFAEFLDGLGHEVDLANHSCYDGGLDIKNMKNGKTSIFFADFDSEVMFHVSPLLPLQADEQQIYKKRHIGNDHVHIVWSENEKTYDRQTITSQFNQAHVIVYPLDTALFRVEVKWKSDMAWFGPLRHFTLVRKECLPSLVRATAINAMLVYYQNQEMTKNVAPMNELARPLGELLRDNIVINASSLKNNTQNENSNESSTNSTGPESLNVASTPAFHPIISHPIYTAPGSNFVNEDNFYRKYFSLITLVTHDNRETPNISLQSWHESTSDFGSSYGPNSPIANASENTNSKDGPVSPKSTGYVLQSMPTAVGNQRTHMNFPPKPPPNQKF